MLDWLKAITNRASGQVALVSPYLRAVIWNISRVFLSLAREAYSANAVVYACLRFLTHAVAEAELMASTVNEEREETPLSWSHPLNQLLLHPNPEMTQYEFIEMMILHLGHVGRSHWYKRRNNAGEVAELWPLRPDRVGPIYAGPEDKNPVISGWTYLPPGLGQPIRLDARDVMTINMPDPASESGGIVEGLGPLQVLAREIESDNEATSFVGALLKNNATPGFILKLTGRIERSQTRRIKRAFMDEFGGNRRGEPAVVDGDVDEVIQSGFHLQQLEFPNLRDVSESRIAAAFGVPAILVGLKVGLQSGIRATIGEQRRLFTETTCGTYWRRIGDRLTLDLASEFGENIVVGFDTSGVRALIEQAKEEAEPIADAFAKGAVTVDEYRDKVLHLPPLEGGAGRVLLIPTNALAVPEHMLPQVTPITAGVIYQGDTRVAEDEAALTGRVASGASDDARSTDADVAAGGAADPGGAAGNAGGGARQTRAQKAATVTAASGNPALRGVRRHTRMAMRSYTDARRERIRLAISQHPRMAKSDSPERDRFDFLLAVRAAVEAEITHERESGELTAVVSQAWQDAAAATIAGQLKALKVDAAPSLSAHTLSQLQQRAEASTALMLEGLKSASNDYLDALPSEGFDPDDAAGDFEDWLAERDAESVDLAGQHEPNTAGAVALGMFLSRNKAELEGEARVVPETAEEEQCADMVSQGWVSLDDASGFALPAHLRCPHYLETRYVYAGDGSDLWLG